MQFGTKYCCACKILACKNEMSSNMMHPVVYYIWKHHIPGRRKLVRESQRINSCNPYLIQLRFRYYQIRSTHFAHTKYTSRNNKFLSRVQQMTKLRLKMSSFCIGGDSNGLADSTAPMGSSVPWTAMPSWTAVQPPTATPPQAAAVPPQVASTPLTAAPPRTERGQQCPRGLAQAMRATTSEYVAQAG